MDRVERAPVQNRTPRDVEVDIEVVVQPLDQSSDRGGAEIDHQISVHGLAWNSVNRTRERAAEVVAHVELIEDVDHSEDDRE